MVGFLSAFKEKFVSNQELSENVPRLDKLISLGVLLWVVAEADGQFLSSEREKIDKILRSYGQISDEEIGVVFESVEEAARQRLDLYSFCQEASEGLTIEGKIEIVEHLFRLACVDGNLAHDEHEAIRKIAHLLRIDHKDFIRAKVKIKKEFGIDTIDI